MRPTTLSATSLNVAMLCMSRFVAEHMIKGASESGTAASLGSVVHAALQDYVELVYLKKTHEKHIKLLVDLYKIRYVGTFGGDFSTDEYHDGLTMVEQWFKRDHIGEREVLSVEEKLSFPVTFTDKSILPIPFTYIRDRFDRVGENEYAVIDYKTSRWNVTPLELRKKIQARAYALATQIEYPNAKRIWVEFDMLRFDEFPVGTAFTREDNANTWRRIRAEAQHILDTSEDETVETLNPECLFCVKKTNCQALRRNITAGGIHALGTEEMIDQRLALDEQRRGVEAAIKEIDDALLPYARERDLIEIESSTANLTFTVRGIRSVDPDRLEDAIGEELAKKYSAKKINMSAIDKLLKGNELTDEQKRNLRSIIHTGSSEPRVKVTAKSPLSGI